MCLDKMLTEGIEIILTLLLFSVQKNREGWVSVHHIVRKGEILENILSINKI